METINKYFFNDMGVMLGRSMRHISRSMDTIITVTIMPIMFMLLFVYVFGGAIQTGTDNYVNYLLPGILLMAISSGIAYTSYRLFMDMQRGIFERFHSMPIARSAPLWGHVLTSLVSNTISVVVMACRSRYIGAIYSGLDMDRCNCRTVCHISRRRRSICLPAYLSSIYQFGVCADRVDAASRSRLCRKSAGDLDRGCHPRIAVRAACRK